VRVAFNRPEVRNAFRPHTVEELYRALDHARMSPDVGVVLLTGNGPSPKTVVGRSAPVATSASAAAAATNTQAAPPRTLLT
jgi:1,4-dihydroxy-2-naphthoyl-CoA synthase